MEVSRPPLVEPLAPRVLPPRGRQHGRSPRTRRHAPGRRHRPLGRDEAEECKPLSSLGGQYRGGGIGDVCAGTEAPPQPPAALGGGYYPLGAGFRSGGWPLGLALAASKGHTFGLAARRARPSPRAARPPRRRPPTSRLEGSPGVGGWGLGVGSWELGLGLGEGEGVRGRGSERESGGEGGRGRGRGRERWRWRGRGRGRGREGGVRG
jgi:hypothetical protein